MKKALAGLVAAALITFSSGAVEVDLRGSKKVLSGPVATLIDEAVALVQANLPWAEEVSLRVVNQSKNYLVDDGRHEKYRKKYDGFNRVYLVGTVEGPGGQQLELVIDADYAQNGLMGVTLLGSEVDLQRLATGTKGSYTLTRSIQGAAAGPFNALDITNTWQNTSTSSSSWVTTGDGIVLSGSYSATGSGAYGQTVRSDNSVNVQSTTVLTGTPPAKGKK